MSNIYYYEYQFNKNAFLDNQKEIIKQLGYKVTKIHYFNFKEELINKKPTNSIIILNFVENASSAGKLFLLFYLEWMRVIKACKKRNNKFVFVFHNLSSYGTNKIKKFISNIFQNYLIRNSDAIQLLNQSSITYINDVFKNKCFYIPHSNYVNTYGPIQKHQNNEYLTLLFFGLIKKYKNIEVLIKIASNLQNKKIRFIICGNISDDKYYKNLLKLASNLNNVHFIPKYMDDEMIPQILSRCDALVLPYHKNTCLNSGVGILAGSYQKTFVCSPISFIKDLPQDLFYTYDFSDEKEHLANLQNTIIKMFQDKTNNPTVLEEKGLLLQKYLINNHSNKIVSNKYKEMFDYLESNGTLE